MFGRHFFNQRDSPRIVRSAHIPRLVLLGAEGRDAPKPSLEPQVPSTVLQGKWIILRSLYLHIVLVKLPCCPIFSLFDIFILASWPVAASFRKRRVIYVM